MDCVNIIFYKYYTTRTKKIQVLGRELRYTILSGTETDGINKEDAYYEV